MKKVYKHNIRKKSIPTNVEQKIEFQHTSSSFVWLSS